MADRVIVVDDGLAALLRETLPRIVEALERRDKPENPAAAATVAEAALELRLSKRKVEQLIADGQINAVRFGRRVVIPRHEIDRLMDIQVKEVG